MPLEFSLRQNVMAGPHPAIRDDVKIATMASILKAAAFATIVIAGGCSRSKDNGAETAMSQCTMEWSRLSDKEQDRWLGPGPQLTTGRYWRECMSSRGFAFDVATLCPFMKSDTADQGLASATTTCYRRRDER